jgi:hypothetical protein
MAKNSHGIKQIGGAIVMIIVALMIFRIVSIFPMQSYNQYMEWKGQMTAMYPDESMNVPNDKNSFDWAVTKKYTIFSGEHFSRLCLDGNENARKAYVLNTNQNRFVAEKPVIVRINLDFGCKNMTYNPQTHETDYGGKLVRFYVSQAVDLPISTSSTPNQ